MIRALAFRVEAAMLITYLRDAGAVITAVQPDAQDHETSRDCEPDEDVATIVEDLIACDSGLLYAENRHNPDDNCSWCWCVFGNDWGEMVTDYSCAHWFDVIITGFHAMMEDTPQLVERVMNFDRAMFVRLADAVDRARKDLTG